MALHVHLAEQIVEYEKAKHDGVTLVPIDLLLETLHGFLDHTGYGPARTPDEIEGVPV
jgi:hypothetical protein